MPDEDKTIRGCLVGNLITARELTLYISTISNTQEQPLVTQDLSFTCNQRDTYLRYVLFGSADCLQANP